jgi:hypothetical protein
LYQVYPVPAHVNSAIQDFQQTVDDIEAERGKPYADQWLAPRTPPDPQTCEACDLRFRCAAFPSGGKLLQTPL